MLKCFGHFLEWGSCVASTVRLQASFFLHSGCWMSSSTRGKHFKAWRVRWIIVAVLCLTSATMGIFLVKWSGPWLLYILLLYIITNECRAISRDGNLTYFCFSLVLFLLFNFELSWGMPNIITNEEISTDFLPSKQNLGNNGYAVLFVFADVLVLAYVKFG